ncbi:hypothetical protein [uncultured Muribaculum sp.]|uniref:hypothetical protein n=1 Tax=uncultured Muribaculum sp. TaxID=1918613 RepID=UPI0025D1D863|nr:hypothetical protein [uncultured Muribaculum sp.]
MKRSLLTCIVALAACAASSAAVVLQEDFSGFKSGSDGAPFKETSVIVDGIVPPDMTQTPGWTGTDVYQAGGCAYIAVGTGVLTTPSVDVSGNAGSYMVKFRAKGESDGTLAFVMDYNNLEGAAILTFTSEWKEYSVAMNAGSTDTHIAFSGMYGAFYIDDIVVDDGGAAIPVALPAADFTRESFTANWEETVGVDSYALNVFTMRYDPVTTIFSREYLLEGKVVESTSFKVTGIDFGTPYYYTVCGCKDGSITKESNRIEVVPGSVSAPVAYDAVEVGDGRFTGLWSESDVATVYAMHVVKIHTASAAGKYDLVSTDFSYFDTEGTVDKPQKELEYRIDGDWEVVMPAFAKGMLGLNNQDFSLFDDAMLLSPVYDLSVGGGNVTVAFDAMGRKNMTKGFIAIGHYKGDGSFEYLDRREFDVTEDLASKSFDFSGCKSNSFILVSSEMLGMLFLDNLRVTVDMNAGERILVPVRTYETPDTSCVAENLGLDDDDTVGYYVNGIYRDKHGYLPEVTSERSNSVIVSGLSGIEDVNASSGGIAVAVDGRSLRISNPYGAEVSVFTVDGRLLMADGSHDAEVSYAAGAAGIYVVRVGDCVVKIAVR